MKIAPFATEEYYALYEFTTPHLLSVSDCETVSIQELLEMAAVPAAELASLRLGYTESQGDPELRIAISETYQNVSQEQVVVLTSPVEGIYLTMRTLLEKGDEAVVLVPAYDALINVAEHICGRVYRWPLQPTPTGWQLDLEDLAKRVTARTKLVIVNFPHNPTGFQPEADQFKAVLEIAGRRGAWVLCDEMYRGLEFGTAPQLPSAADLYERSIVLSGLSKTYGLPGLRAGWLVVRDDETRQALINWKYYTTICPAAPTEFLAKVALNAGQMLSSRSKQIVSQNLKLAQLFFNRWNQFFTWRAPQAGSVALVEIHVPSAKRYCHELAREAGVLLLPATFMGAEDRYVRFGFGRRSFGAALAYYEQYLEQGHLQ